MGKLVSLDQYKIDAVKEAAVYMKPLAVVATKFNVNTTTLKGWIKAYSDAAFAQEEADHYYFYVIKSR